MNIIITTGGTGGHIFPALALAKEIQEKEPSFKLIFVGAKYGMEEELCQKAGIGFKALEVEGFVGKGLRSIKAFILLFKAFFAARQIIKNEDIDCVIGFGGYASAPSILAAKSLKKPIFFHEQNAFPGAVHRVFAAFAHKIMLSIPIEKTVFPQKIKEKCVLTGNPVRTEIAKLYHDNTEAKQEREKIKILILGGSLGAQSINSLICDILPKLHKEDIEILHQCGKAEEERIKNCYKESPYSPSCVHAFIDDMKTAYSQADIVIARAGASTLAELACASKASILIPFPFAAHNHQYYNAKSLVDKDACILIEEHKMYKNKQVINSSLLITHILSLAASKERRYTLSSNIKTFAKPYAVEQMFTLIKNEMMAYKAK